MDEKYQLNIEVAGLSSKKNPVMATQESIAFGKERIMFRDIQALRAANIREVVGFSESGHTYKISFREYSGKETDIRWDTPSGRKSDQGTEDFNAIMGVLIDIVGRRLANDYVRMLEAGEFFRIGETNFTPQGVVVLAPGFLMKKEKLVSWQNLGWATIEGAVALFHNDKRKWMSALSLQDTWNGMIIQPMLQHMKNTGKFQELLSKYGSA